MLGREWRCSWSTNIRYLCWQILDICAGQHRVVVSVINQQCKKHLPTNLRYGWQFLLPLQCWGKRRRTWTWTLRTTATAHRHSPVGKIHGFLCRFLLIHNFFFFFQYVITSIFHMPLRYSRIYPPSILCENVQKSLSHGCVCSVNVAWQRASDCDVINEGDNRWARSAI